ncbi:MAG: hypothetical protein ABI047_11900 [Jatrophihabitantaceae bacterium]
MQQGRPNLKKAAHRVLGDLDFGQAVLEGREDYPELRAAILADLAGPSGLSVSAFTRLHDPSANPEVLRDYVENGPKPGGMNVYRLIENTAAW